jgi:hypothetical protein
LPAVAAASGRPTAAASLAPTTSRACRADLAAAGTYQPTVTATAFKPPPGIEQNLSNNTRSTTTTLALR